MIVKAEARARAGKEEGIEERDFEQKAVVGFLALAWSGLDPAGGGTIHRIISFANSYW